MKNIIIIMLLGCWLCSCEEEEFSPYTGKDYVQFVSPTVPGQSSYEVTFKWAAVDATHDYDTIYLPIQTMGQIYDRDRHVMVKQETLLETEYVYNELGAVVDTLVYAAVNQAQKGVHYLAFDTPAFQEMMKIHANSTESEMAIILKRDRQGAQVPRKLKVRLIDTDEVLAGDPWSTSCVITIE